MEILRALAIGVLAGAIYAWPFAASKSYKRLVLTGVRQGRAIALLQKIVSLIVGAAVALGSIILVRVVSTESFALIDFVLFLGAAVAAGWLAWRYLYNSRSLPPA
jgi:hypothetical protein